MASKPSGIAREAATLGNVLAAGVFLGAVAPFVRRAVEAGVAGEQPAALIGAALLGAVAADLASGVVHWACDTFFAEDTPVIGRALIFPFREDHRDPLHAAVEEPVRRLDEQQAGHRPPRDLRVRRWRRPGFAGRSG